MARNEDDSPWEGLGTITVRSPDCRDKVGPVAALARCVRSLFARTGAKTLATGKTLQVVSWLTPTGEHHTMKDVNGNNAFVHIGGVTYISAAHVATTVAEFHHGCHASFAKGCAHDHSWEVEGSGGFLLETRPADRSSIRTVSGLPKVEAFLEAPTVGELKYSLKIDTTDAKATLEALRGTVSDTKLGVDLAALTSEQRKELERAVLEALEKEKRQGGLLWQAGTVNNTTFHAAPPVKSIDDFADEYMAPYIKEGTLTDCVIRKAYASANLRLSLRAQYAKGEV